MNVLDISQLACHHAIGSYVPTYICEQKQIDSLPRLRMQVVADAPKAAKKKQIDPRCHKGEVAAPSTSWLQVIGCDITKAIVRVWQ